MILALVTLASFDFLDTIDLDFPHVSLGYPSQFVLQVHLTQLIPLMLVSFMVMFQASSSFHLHIPHMVICIAHRFNYSLYADDFQILIWKVNFSPVLHITFITINISTIHQLP